MRLYRLASRRYAGKLDGGGNRDHGARWNSGRGRGVVYASFSLATSILEMMVHFGPSQRVRLPKNIMLVEIEAPDDAGVETVRQEDIPKTSERLDATGRTWRQRRGDEWLDRGGGGRLFCTLPSRSRRQIKTLC